MIIAETDIVRVPVTVGVDLGGTGTRVVTLGAHGDVVSQLTLPTPVAPTGTPVDTLAGALRNVSAGLPVTAVGIGASGPVTADGVIRNPATLPAFTGLDLCGLLERRLGCRCVIGNCWP